MSLIDLKVLNAKRDELMDIVPKVLSLCGEPEENLEYHIKLALADIDNSLESYRLMHQNLTGLRITDYAQS